MTDAKTFKTDKTERLQAAQNRYWGALKRREDWRDKLGLVTLDEFATMARMSRRTLYRLLAKEIEGFPRPHRLSYSRQLFKIDEIQRWVDSRPW